MLWSVDKKIQEWHGRRRGSSMWKEGGVCIPGEIVPKRSKGPWRLGASFLEG